MPLETISFLSDLIPSNPTVADNVSLGDDHIRGIKTALKNTFPSFTAAPLISSQSELDAVAHTGQINAQDGSITAPSIGYKADNTAGFFRNAPGHQMIVGRLLGNGTVPVGSIHDFPKVPATLGTEYLECDGAVYNISSYPDLGAFLGATFGGDGNTTFGVPNLKDTGRFRRSRTSIVAAGSAQANDVKSHTHSGTSALAGGHTHTATVIESPHAHSIAAGLFTPANATAAGPNPAGGTSGAGTTAPATTGIAVTIAAVGDHAHTFVTDATGGSETRPESFVVVSCIKT